MTKIVSRDAWLEARRELLAKEKAFNTARDALTRERQGLPWVAVETPYRFRNVTGDKSLSDLFGDCSQLVVYHFMYHPDWGDEACKSCSFWADNFNGIEAHLKARDVAFVAISRASVEQIEAYRKRMGWGFEWLSSLGTSFNDDFGVGFDDAAREANKISYNYRTQNFVASELPGVSVFARDADGRVCHTYSTYSRGLDMLNGAYHFLDLVPRGRDEAALSWPQAWIRRRDEYETDANG